MASRACRPVADQRCRSSAGHRLPLGQCAGGHPVYDAPSQQGKKLYLIKAQTPIEVVVKLEGWFKVRDAEGHAGLAGVAQSSDERRTLVVTAPQAEISQSDKPESSVLAELDKWVAVEFIEPASPGWAKVRHRDGATGYVRSTQVWGL